KVNSGRPPRKGDERPQSDGADPPRWTQIALPGGPYLVVRPKPGTPRRPDLRCIGCFSDHGYPRMRYCSANTPKPAGYPPQRYREWFQHPASPAAPKADLSVQVPTYNPYYPTGAPTNLRVNYNMSIEAPSFTSALEVSDRYLGGLNIDLPGNWSGKIYYSESFDDTHTTVNSVNANA